MAGLGPTELIIILVIVLLLFGAKRLPELFGSVGQSIKEFRKATAEDETESTPRSSSDGASSSES